MAGSVDWLSLCRRVVERQRRLFAEHAGIAARTVYEGIGEGGDRALVIDRRCEDVVFDELERAAGDGAAVTAVSEERGTVAIGREGSETLVVIDPIDGSLNARRMLPSHSLSVAVASGPSMADVDFGYVYDFGAGEEFVAERDRGAQLDGEELRAEGPGHGLEVVGLESAEPSRILPAIEALQGKAYRVRAVGSIAISLGYVAAGRFDGMLTARACRSVDAAAAQLIAREAGAQVEFAGLPLAEAGLDLEARYRLAAALDAESLRTLRQVQDADPVLKA